MGQILVFSFTAMANPTLVAAVTVMLLLPNPKSLMLGYLCGALITSITLGLVIVFAAEDAGVTNSAKHTINPVIDLVLGGILLVLAVVLHSGRDQPVRERRAERKREKQAGKPVKTPRWQRELGKGDPRITFVMGIVLTLPGASYLAALTTLAKQDYNTTVTVLVVVLINVIMMGLLEVPLISYYVAPDETPRRVERAKVALHSHGRRWLMIGAAIIGALLIVRGVITSFT
jgi:hypothetical protein